MSSKQYWKNQLPVILINLLGMLALALFLIASGNGIQTVLFVLVVWLIILISCLLLFYYSRKKHLDKLLDMTEKLDERYLLPEIMQEPERADEQVFYQIMKMSEKSMLEHIGEIQRERQEYKEYIEQWIHEVKTPITAMKLICENNRCSFTRDLMAELENINRFTEQALYYARSEHTEKDYSVREIRLSDVVHGAIADNKYLLRQNNVAVTVENVEYSIYSDDKHKKGRSRQLRPIHHRRMKTIKKGECSYSVSNAIRTLAMVRSTGLEPVPLSDTPLKRARMPIPPRSRVAVLQR